MDVVDLAQPRERAAGREIERPCALSTRAHRGAKLQQALAFDGARARDQGADGVDEVELDELPRGVGGAFACSDMASEPFEGGHVATTRVAGSASNSPFVPAKAGTQIADPRPQIPSDPLASPRSVSANSASSGSILLIMPCSKV